MSQTDPKTTSFMTSLTENRNLQPKYLFRVQTRRLAEVWTLEQLSSAIGRGAMALVRQPKTAGFRPKSRYKYIVGRLSKC